MDNINHRGDNKMHTALTVLVGPQEVKKIFLSSSGFSLFALRSEYKSIYPVTLVHLSVLNTGFAKTIITLNFFFHHSVCK